MGLLAKAEAYLQHEAEMRIAAEKQAAEEQMALAAAIKARPSKTEMMKNTASKIANGAKVAKSKLTHLATDFQAKFQTAIKKAYQPQLRRIAIALLLTGLNVPNAALRNYTNNTAYQKNLDFLTQNNIQITEEQMAQIHQIIKNANQNLHKSQFSEQDRDDLARLLYGEAGCNLADAVEVLHTVLNRYASPLFKGSMHDIITAKNQYIGYSPKHPVDKKLRALVDYEIKTWEQNNCQAIDGCDRYYFVTGEAGINNKFEISEKGSQGRWVSTAQKHYDNPGHYCHCAVEHADNFNRWYNHQQTQHTRSM